MNLERQDELLLAINNRGVRSILLLHRTDRWYFGDFIRHSSWIQWAADRFPGVELALASHPAYVSLYRDDRIVEGLDSRNLSLADIAKFDLVIEPAPFDPGVLKPVAPMHLLTWDSGWRLFDGERVMSGVKNEINYFRAASPTSIDAAWSGVASIRLGPNETQKVETSLAKVVGPQTPVFIYNPTASNPYTRDTALVKEVDNTLDVAAHLAALSALVDAFDDHAIVVGSAIKNGDQINQQVIRDLVSLAKSSRVVSIFDLSHDFTSLRGFAALLSAKQVCACVGGGTGTNTHLASLVNKPSLSFERAADEAMIRNWNDSTAFQMGSFRWRNPALSVGIHTLAWDSVGEKEMVAAARAFETHHSLTTHCGQPQPVLDVGLRRMAAEFAAAWRTDTERAAELARRAAERLPVQLADHLLDFDDEEAWLGNSNGGVPVALLDRGESHSPTSTEFRRLFDASNFFKFLMRLAEDGDKSASNGIFTKDRK